MLATVSRLSTFGAAVPVTLLVSWPCLSASAVACAGLVMPDSMPDRMLPVKTIGLGLETLSCKSHHGTRCVVTVSHVQPRRVDMEAMGRYASTGMEKNQTESTAAM